MSTLFGPFIDNEFMRNALLAGVLVSMLCALVGTWVVLRGLSFVGDALAHGVLPGIAVAMLMGAPTFAGAAVGALVMMGGVNVVQKRTRLSADTAVGLLFVGMLALGVVILSRLESYAGSLTTILFGDILGVTGTLFRTKTNELTIQASSVRLLTKSLRPLPDKFHGLADQEQKYRQRYVDLIVTPEARDVFVARSRIIASMRRWLDERRFLDALPAFLAGQLTGPQQAWMQQARQQHPALDAEARTLEQLRSALRDEAAHEDTGLAWQRLQQQLHPVASAPTRGADKGPARASMWAALRAFLHAALGARPALALAHTQLPRPR